MRPYIAVIVDSFRAALASKVLWVAIAAIWLVIGLLALAGYREVLTAEFSRGDFRNAKRFKAQLVRASAIGSDADERDDAVMIRPTVRDQAVAKMLTQMPEDLRSKLNRFADGEDLKIDVDDFADALNELLDNDQWYDADLYEGLAVPREADKLVELGTDEAIRRVRRLRIESAFPGVFRTRPSLSIRPTYAWLDFPQDLPIASGRFQSVINQFVLPLIISFLLGFVLVFLGIVVTAPIIPGMLQPGSLHLLLSKPITRSSLLWSKFFGGCAFVLLCVSQLVIGLYLVAGFRLDIWNLRLLWCIPASVFIFSVFYSVSVAAGLIFRSEVLSIGITCFFGGLVWITGTIGGLFDGFVTGPDRVARVDRVGEHVVGLSQNGLRRFDPSESAWVEIADAGQFRQDRNLMPVAIQTPDGVRLASTKIERGEINPFGLGASTLRVYDPQNNWDSVETITLRPATTGLFAPGGERLFGVTLSQIYEIPIKDAIKSASDDDKDDQAKPQGGLFSRLSNLMGDGNGEFVNILPPDVGLSQPRDIAFAPDASSLWIASGSRLLRLTPGGDDADTDDDNRNATWSIEAEAQLNGPRENRLAMAVSGGVIMVGRKDSAIETFDAETLEPARTIEGDFAADMLQIRGIDDGKFAVLSTDGSLRIIDSANGGFTTVSGNDFESIGTLDDGGKLMAAEKVDRLVRIDPATADRVDAVRPSLSTWRKIDRYLMSPLRFVVPQTGEFGNVIASAISGEDAVVIEDASGDGPAVSRYDFVRPIVSCGGFILVMMLFNTVYFATRDF